MKLLLHIKKTILPAFLLIAGFCVSQNSLLDSLSNNFNKYSVEESRQLLQKIDTLQIKPYDKALWYFYSGLNYRKNDQHDLGYKDLLLAEKRFSKLDDWEYISITNYEIHVLLGHQQNSPTDAKPYLVKCMKFAKLTNKPLVLAKAYSRFGSDFMQKDNFEKSKKYFDSTKIELNKIENKVQREIKISLINLNIATLYRTVAKKNDSAIYFYQKTLPTFRKYNLNGYIANNYNNIAALLIENKNYKKAIIYYRKADSIPLNEYSAKTKVVYYDNLAKAYDKIKDYKNAALYLNKFIKLKDSINDEEQNKAIADINTKYKTAEKDKEIAEQKAKNLVQEAEKKQKDSLLIISLSILALVIISAYLLQKNTRKKQLLAEQAKDLEEQKVSTLLKEQELASIDAMIEGQEKERKRIAEDLHDDLGALMATINLHLENVGSENSPNALDKTKSLLSEAYEKIRNMSHVKNAGVIANEGLLRAIQNMTSKISSANKIDIEVIAPELKNRLENSLELSLFRTIQELLTNIIKHAEATKATIQLTQFNESLNIIVEDNGKGFDISKIKESGIGLSNIKKRITHLEGTLSIDSTLGRGTTIVIDIPLKS